MLSEKLSSNDSLNHTTLFYKPCQTRPITKKDLFSIQRFGAISPISELSKVLVEAFFINAFLHVLRTIIFVLAKNLTQLGYGRRSVVVTKISISFSGNL